MASHHANVNNFGQMRFWRGTVALRAPTTVSHALERRGSAAGEL